MLIVFIRTLILYFTIIIVIRLMGKRQLGELQPYELVITIMISDLASLPMENTKFPLLLGIIPIITLLLIKTLLLEMQVRIPFISDIMDGKPIILINNGELQTQNLKTQKMTIDDLFEEIREKGFLDIQDIKFAILENNGSISIFPMEELNTVSKKDLNIKTTNTILPKVLYIDGKFIKKTLKELNKDISWVTDELKNIDAPPIDDLFLITLNSKNEISFETY